MSTSMTNCTVPHSFTFDPTEQMRQQQRVLRRTNRDLERDRHSLERQEKQLVRALHHEFYQLHHQPHLSLNDQFSRCVVLMLAQCATSLPTGS